MATDWLLGVDMPNWVKVLRTQSTVKAPFSVRFNRSFFSYLWRCSSKLWTAWIRTHAMSTVERYQAPRRIAKVYARKKKMVERINGNMSLGFESLEIQPGGFSGQIRLDESTTANNSRGCCRAHYVMCNASYDRMKFGWFSCHLRRIEVVITFSHRSSASCVKEFERDI